MKVKKVPSQSPSGGLPQLRLVERVAGPIAGATAKALDGATVARPSQAPEPALDSLATPGSGTRFADPAGRFADPAGRADAAGEASQQRPSRARALESLLALADGRLVPLALAGDALAQEALYRKHVSFAIHLATRIEGSARDVEDVVHDAFIKALTRLADLADPQAFRSWLGSIVVHAVRSRLRRARLMSMLGLSRGADPIEIDSVASSEASPHVRAQLAQIYALLRTLPTDERIAWTLRYVEGNELDIVARLTACSLATVKRRISRAQKFLQEHFIGVDGAPGADSDSEKPSSSAGSLSDSVTKLR